MPSSPAHTSASSSTASGEPQGPAEGSFSPNAPAHLSPHPPPITSLLCPWLQRRRSALRPQGRAPSLLVGSGFKRECPASSPTNMLDHIHPRLPHPRAIFTPLLHAIDEGKVPLEKYAFGSRGPASVDAWTSQAVYRKVRRWLLGSQAGGVLLLCSCTEDSTHSSFPLFSRSRRPTALRARQAPMPLSEALGATELWIVSSAPVAPLTRFLSRFLTIATCPLHRHAQPFSFATS